MAAKKKSKSISAAKRKSLPTSSFVYPKERKYPIDTKARARNALSRAAQSGTSGSYETVRRKVKAKYGDSIQTGGQKKKSGRKR